jgi:hypothetical protein
MDIRFKNTEAYLKSFAESKLVQYFLESYETTRPRSGGINSQVRSSGEGGSSLNVRVQNDGLDINLYGNSYLEGVDKGTAPFFPNVDAIRNWITTKPVTLRDARGGTMPRTESNIKSVAYKIGEAISLRGIAPANYIREVVERAFEEIVGGITPSLKADVKDKLDDILTKAGYTKKGDTYVLKTK